MTEYKKLALACALLFVGFIVAYCKPGRVEAQTMMLPEVVESTPTPDCYFDEAGNFLCQSHTNDLTPTATIQSTATPSLTPTPTSPLSTPFEPTVTPVQSPTVTPTPTTIIIRPFHQLFLPLVLR